MKDKSAKFTALKSFDENCVKINIHLYSSGWRDPSIRVSSSADISIVAARQLASDLIAKADEADARLTKKQEATDRRKKWVEREIAAGRIRMISR